MIRAVGSVAALIIFLIVFGAFRPLNAAADQPSRAGTTPAQAQATRAVSVCQARRTIVTALQHACYGCWGLERPPSGIAFNVEELEFQAEPTWDKKLFPRGAYRVDLKTLGVVTNDGGQLRVDGKLPAHSSKNHSSASVLAFIAWSDDAGPGSGYQHALAFSKAMNTLRIYARTSDYSRGLPPPCFADKEARALFWREFRKRADAWRALPARPQLSEAVRKQLLLAEDAVNQKQFVVASAAYDAGTEIDLLWPEGHFNAALIHAELKEYRDAVWHMRCYLELLPNTPDAQNARDQMLLWQAKLEQQAAARATQ